MQVMRKAPTHNSQFWCGKLKKAAYAMTVEEFEVHLNTIFIALPHARDFIVDSEPAHWANSLFGGKQWGEINNNVVESWNAWVKEERSLPPCNGGQHKEKNNDDDE